MPLTPLVTVVTPCYNSAATLPRTIESVLGQSYQNIQYLIMDGASTDNTAAVVAPYLDDPRLTFVSEHDDGQSDAINKGWARADGEILAWLCADDLYLPETVEKAVVALEANADVGWVYGYDRYIDGNGDPVPFNHRIGPWNYEAYRDQSLYISQPTTFWRRDVIETCGNLRTDLHYMMDFEFYLRIGREYPGLLLDEVLAVMTWTRDTKTFSGSLERMWEMVGVMKLYGGGYHPAQTVREQWAEAHLRAVAGHLSRFEFGRAADLFRKGFRWPAAVPRGVAKLLLRSLVPSELETRLRTLLVRRQTP